MPAVLYVGWLEVFHNYLAAQYGVVFCMVGIVGYLMRDHWLPLLSESAAHVPEDDDE
jgi:hypothetical protein